MESKFRFETGEIDMVVEDRKEGGCSLYEIKHSVRTSPEQRKNLKSTDKCAKIEYSYGPINGKYVIYRGQDKDEGGVSYLNVENYLRSLNTDTR
ncbi:MAG: hypothetical protein LUD47_07110 [Clostridia bacterium]|nr:hypothetical protein [Clostridia bacterium]